MVARRWSYSRLSCGEHLPLRCDGNARNSFPSTKGKDPSYRARRRKRGSYGFGRDSRAVAAGSRFPSRGSRDLWLSHEAFPQGCPTCHRGVSGSSASKSRQCRENRFPWNGLRHLGDSGNGGTTRELLSPFLWRAPSLEKRQECREFFSEL